jgi:hypothetical protein
MVDEANLIRTVILRVQTFPDSIQSSFREEVKKYLQTRIDYYEYAEDSEKFNKTKQDAAEIGRRLWDRTIDLSHVTGFNVAANNMLAALTPMFDVGARRDALLMSGVPTPVTLMLFLIAIVISFVGGFTSPVLKAKEWVVIAGFIFLAWFIIYLTIDMARPMRGFIRPDVGQDRIVQLMELF